MNDFAAFASTYQALERAQRAGCRADPGSELAKQRESLETALGALAYQQLPEFQRAMAENPNDPRSRAELLACADRAAEHIRKIVEPFQQSGLE